MENQKDPILLTEAEWAVMEPLWRQAPQTAMELARQLADTVGWAKSTSMTMLSRMEAKGLLRYEQRGRTKLYFPCLDRQQAAMQQTRRFLDRVYQGSVSLMVSALLDKNSLSSQQIRQLRQLLDQAEEAEK